MLTPELDAGPILFQQRVAIGAHDTVTELYRRLNDVQRVSLAQAVDRHLDGDPGVPQDEASATYGCARVPDDGEIDWTRTTEEVYALVRALVEPYPGAFTHVDGRRLTVWDASPVSAPARWAGRVPGDGVLRLSVVEPDGEGRQPAASAIRSVRATLGLRSVDLLERLRALEGERP